MNPKINLQKIYIPKIYGFKLFGKRGSKYYELVKSAKKQIRGEGNGENNKGCGDKTKIDAFITKFNQLNIS